MRAQTGEILGIVLVDRAAIEQDKPPVIRRDCQGVCVVGCQDQVGQVVDHDGIPTLLLVIDGRICDEILELVSMLMEALDFVHLNAHPIHCPVCESPEEVVLRPGRLVGAVSAEDFQAEELEDDALATPLSPIERQGHLGLEPWPLKHVRQITMDKHGVRVLCSRDDIADMPGNIADQLRHQRIVYWGDLLDCKAFPHVVHALDGIGWVHHDLLHRALVGILHPLWNKGKFDQLAIFVFPPVLQVAIIMQQMNMGKQVWVVVLAYPSVTKWVLDLQEAQLKPGLHHSIRVGFRVIWIDGGRIRRDLGLLAYIRHIHVGWVVSLLLLVHDSISLGPAELDGPVFNLRIPCNVPNGGLGAAGRTLAGRAKVLDLEPVVVGVLEILDKEQAVVPFVCGPWRDQALPALPPLVALDLPLVLRREVLDGSQRCCGVACQSEQLLQHLKRDRKTSRHAQCCVRRGGIALVALAFLVCLDLQEQWSWSGHERTPGSVRIGNEEREGGRCIPPPIVGELVQQRVTRNAHEGGRGASLTRMQGPEVAVLRVD